MTLMTNIQKRFAVLLFSLCASAVQAHDHDAAATAAVETLGEVDFPVTCIPAAQTEFNRAMALLHSFWYSPAQASFATVLELDPECGMAHWGLAFASMGNPFTWSSNPGAAKLGAVHAQLAHNTGANSARERDYIAAQGIFFHNWQTVSFAQRVADYVRAMTSLAERYPQDDEAKILQALAINFDIDPADKTFAKQSQAMAILEPLFVKYPRHPGIAHYVIHTNDYSELATRALPAARTYAGIAPSVPHALHMPSHIFSRVGLWPDMVTSNRASYNAARAELDAATLTLGNYNALHAMDYMLFAHLQQAQDRAAQAILEETQAIKKIQVENFAAAYALAAIPARFALERKDWPQAAALTLSPADMGWEKFPQAESILVFARGLGAARSGDIDAARSSVARLQTLNDQMRAANLGYWPTQTDIQIQAVDAWIAFAEGQPDVALGLMRAAATAEDASDKHPVTPGNVVPSRELLGDMLLELQQPAAALNEYVRSLQRDPNRYHGLSGAARAAAASGNNHLAREYFTQLQAQTVDSDSARPELAEARRFFAAQ